MPQHEGTTGQKSREGVARAAAAHVYGVACAAATGGFVWVSLAGKGTPGQHAHPLLHARMWGWCVDYVERAPRAVWHFR